MFKTFNKELFYKGDAFSIAYPVLHAVHDADDNVIFGTPRLDGQLLRSNETPLFSHTIQSFVPREGYINAYSLSLSTVIYARTNKTGFSLTEKLSKEEMLLRKKIETFDCYIDMLTNPEERVAIRYIDETIWNSTTFSESFFGDQDQDRIPYSYVTILWDIETKGLPYV